MRTLAACGEDRHRGAIVPSKTKSGGVPERRASGGLKPAPTTGGLKPAPTVAAARARAGFAVGFPLALALAAALPGCASCRDERASAADAGGDASTTHDAAASLAAPALDVLASASTLADGGAWVEAGGPAVRTYGTVDGAALRKAHAARLRADRSAVHVESGGTPRELGARLCAAVVPKRPPETKVLLKPNLGGFDWFKDPAKSGGDDGLRGRITDPEFVRGVVQCLKKRGHTKITVAEGWGARPEDWRRLVKVSGYEAMAREEGVPLVAMDDDGVFDVADGGPGQPYAVTGIEDTSVPTLLVPRILAEHLEDGLFVSLPKMKAHRFAVFSAGIKGMQGVVMRSDAAPAYKQKWRMHEELDPLVKRLGKGDRAVRAAYVAALETFSTRMADVLELATPDAVLAEGAPAMGGDGFQRLVPVEGAVAVGGTNPVLVDRVVAAWLGAWDDADLARELGGHRTSPLLEVAAARWGIDLTAPALTGPGAALVAEPRATVFVGMDGFRVERGAVTPPAPDGGLERPTLRAPFVDALPVIDGVVDAAWARATPVTFDTDWSGAPTGISTRVRMLASNAGLAALFELEGAGLYADASKPKDVDREKLWAEDCVEVFVAPDPSRPARYAEVEVGPHGHFLDLFVDRDARPRTSDVAWSSAPRIATRVARGVDGGSARVTIEVALAAPEIARALRPGARLPLGLYRLEGKAPRAYLAWSPTRTPKPDFHVPDAFGWLVVD